MLSFNVHTHAEEIEIREQENHLIDQLIVIHCQYKSKLISTVGTKKKKIISSNLFKIIFFSGSPAPSPHFYLFLENI